MPTKIILKQNNYYCGNCYMKLSEIQPHCCFCNAIFSNFEEILVKNYEDLHQFENHFNNRPQIGNS